jgi:hypothetical protein
VALEPGAEPGGRRRHHLGLALGARPQAVIDMDGGDGAAGGGGQDQEGK